MSITIQFKDFNEMLDFAKVLLGRYQSEPDKTEAAKPETKSEKKETVSNNSTTPEDEGLPFEGEPTKTYTLEEVRAKLAELSRAGKQKEVKALISSFRAKTLPEVDPKDYPALMEKAGAL